jgi:hypothetical protein
MIMKSQFRVAFDLSKTPAGKITSKHSLEAAEILARLG